MTVYFVYILQDHYNQSWLNSFNVSKQSVKQKLNTAYDWIKLRYFMRCTILKLIFIIRINYN